MLQFLLSSGHQIVGIFFFKIKLIVYSGLLLLFFGFVFFSDVGCRQQFHFSSFDACFGLYILWSVLQKMMLTEHRGFL